MPSYAKKSPKQMNGLFGVINFHEECYCKLALSIHNKMDLHNQFADLDYRKQPAQKDLPPKLKRAKSFSTKISRQTPILPRLDSRASIRDKARRIDHTKLGRKVKTEGEYRAYLQQAHYIQRTDQLASLPVTLASSFRKFVISPLECIPEYPVISISNRIDKSARVKLQLHKQKSLVKYKILAEMGYSDEEVLQMSEAEQQQLQEEYLRKKGKQYLRESRLRIKTGSAVSMKSKQKNSFSPSPQKDKNYVREIFKDVSEAARIKAQARELVKREKLFEQERQRKLKQCEEVLGNHVYRRVVEHINSSNHKKPNFFEQKKREQKVDEALINFIKFKIKRIHTTLQ